MNARLSAPLSSSLTGAGSALRAAGAGLLAAGGAAGLLGLWPGLEIGLFARGAAALAGALTGAGIVPVDDGWMLATAGRPVVVTAACSATSYFLTLATLLAWQLARGGRPLPLASLAGLAAALPLTILVNAVRVVAVIQAHRWVIPHFPDAYAHFLHLLTGVAVFLPSLIAINLTLEHRGRLRPAIQP